MKKHFNKNGLSEIIGYILLISFALIMSFIVYQGLVTYVPVSKADCSEGVSILVRNYSCVQEGERYILNLSVKNNGKFDIAGYFIYSANKSNQTIATLPVANFLVSGIGLGTGIRAGNAILFDQSNENSVTLNEGVFAQYNLTGKMYSLDITPARYQRDGKKLRLVVCGSSKISEKINCNP